MWVHADDVAAWYVSDSVIERRGKTCTTRSKGVSNSATTLKPAGERAGRSKGVSNSAAVLKPVGERACAALVAALIALVFAGAMAFAPTAALARQADGSSLDITTGTVDDDAADVPETTDESYAAWKKSVARSSDESGPTAFAGAASAAAVGPCCCPPIYYICICPPADVCARMRGKLSFSDTVVYATTF